MRAGGRAVGPGERGVAGDATHLDEIIVTARKTSESLQKTPVSISAFSADRLKTQGAVNISDLQSQTPSLNVSQASSDPLSNIIGIRGQIQNDTLLLEQPSAGVYFDGVYYGETVGSALSVLTDVDRVEILKGPQGTLYGRNTTGGAITVYSKLPNNSYEGDLKVGYGDYDEHEVSGFINIPIIQDKLAARLVASYTGHDGYAQNLFDAGTTGSNETVVVRGAVKFDPSSKVDIVVRGDYSHGDSNGSILQPVYMAPGSLGIAEISAEIFGVANAFNPANLAAAAQAYQHYINLGQDGRTFSYNTPQNNVAQTGGGSVQVNYAINNDLNLKSITAYRWLSRQFLLDLDASPYFIANGYGDTKAGQFSQELNLSGTSFGDRLGWIVGAYYYDMVGHEIGQNSALPELNPDNPSTDDTKDLNESEAVFGQATYKITNALRFTGGLRWTNDRSRLEALSHDAFSCQVPVNDRIDGACDAIYRTSASAVSYTAGLDYAFSEGTFAYIKTSKGFKGGGINERGSAEEGSFAAFAPETVTDYEVGFKSDFFNRRLRTDIAYYHSIYDNIQRSIIVPGPGGSPNTIVQNAASASIDGVEAAVDLIPFERAAIHATTAYTDARYTKFVDGEGNDLSSEPFLLLPRWTYSVSGDYRIPTQGGEFRATLNWHWQSSESTSPALRDDLTPSRTQKSYGLLDGVVSFKPAALDGPLTGVELSFWAKNIADTRYRTLTLDLAGSVLGPIYEYLGPPRTFGGTIEKRF
jgi:iron complex outermembrane receptor protein